MNAEKVSIAHAANNAAANSLAFICALLVMKLHAVTNSDGKRK